MWSNKQKHLVHFYARHAGLADPEYRAILYASSGCRSAKHPGLTQFHFDHVMAELERTLDWRIQEGFVERPSPAAVPDLFHWRRRLSSDGALNSRHAHTIRELWQMLCVHLPASERTPQYLAGIATKACGDRIDDVWACRAWQAGLLISALRDRLHYAVRAGTASALPVAVSLLSAICCLLSTGPQL